MSFDVFILDTQRSLCNWSVKQRTHSKNTLNAPYPTKQSLWLLEESKKTLNIPTTINFQPSIFNPSFLFFGDLIQLQYELRWDVRWIQAQDMQQHHKELDIRPQGNPMVKFGANPEIIGQKTNART
jgi:hypothetical protein